MYRYKIFIGVGGITCILGGNLQSSSEAVRSVLIIFKLFNVRTDRFKPDAGLPLAVAEQTPQAAIPRVRR
jgi:hypothetical protein